MNKIAIFVEGQTELLFMEQLIQEIANTNEVRIEQRRGFGGGESNKIRRMNLVKRTGPDHDYDYFALIVDCGGDSRVASDIREEYENLVESGYEAIIGIRDVYPEIKREEIPRLRRGLHFGTKKGSVKVDYILSIMEIEAWFLQEYSHFHRLHRDLNLEIIKKKLGLDLRNDDISKYPHPADDLARIYRLVRMEYTKRRANTQRTLDALAQLPQFALFFD